MGGGGGGAGPQGRAWRDGPLPPVQGQTLRGRTVGLGRVQGGPPGTPGPQGTAAAPQPTAGRRRVGGGGRYEAWLLVGVWGAPGLSSRGSCGPAEVAATPWGPPAPAASPLCTTVVK